MSESNPNSSGAVRRRLVCLAALTLTALPLTLAAGATPADAAPARPVAARPAAVTCALKYTVKAGDSWYRIASKVKVTPAALLKANKATTRTWLWPGQVVCLPKGAVVATPVPAVKLTYPKVTYTAAQTAAIIRKVWPDNLEAKAIAIAQRESHLNNLAHNWCCYGLFQIYFNASKAWLASVGVTNPSQLLDPNVAATVAYKLYLRSGWAPWAV
jgi:LysM repeat protein